MDFNIRVFRYLLTVVEEGHFGRAAAKLLITAPTLTYQIQRLEREVGFPLLDRTVHPVVPTRSGAVFLDEARNLLAAADRLESVAQIEAQRRKGQFRLGFVGTPLGRFTRSMVDDFAQTAGPHVLSLVELSLADQMEAVASEEVDASLVWFPEPPPPHLRMERAFPVPRMLAVSADHRLANRASVTLAETDEETYTWMMPSKRDDLWRRWWYVDPRPSGRWVKFGREARTVNEVLEEVAMGRAVTIVAALLADTNQRGDVAFLPIEDVEAAEVGLCTRANDTSPSTELMRRIFTHLLDTHGNSPFPR